MKGATTDNGTTEATNQLNSNEFGTGRETKDIATADIFEILSNNRRRRVLSHLRENGERSDIRALSEHLAALENDVEPHEVNSKQRMRTYTALRQSHLPKMDRKGIVDFDENSGEVSLEATNELEKFLNVDLDNELRWIQYYLGIGFIGFVVSFGVYTDIFAFEWIPDVLAGLITSIAIIIASIAHYLYVKLH